MINADQLTKVFAKMEEIEIHKLSPYYSCRAVENGGAIVNCVLDAILDRSNNLKKLLLNCAYKWTNVNSVRRVTTLNRVAILDVCLYEEEANLLFKKIVEEETSVISLCLRGCLRLSQLEPDHLCGVFDKLKEFCADAGYSASPLFHQPADPGVVKLLFEKIAAGSNLRKLQLTNFSDISQVAQKVKVQY